MYGTIARFTPKPGQEAAVISLIEEWEGERAPNVSGAKAGYVYKPDNKLGELVMTVVFEDRASYRANAGDPKQDEWYRKFRDLLQADPVWEDGEIVCGRAW